MTTQELQARVADNPAWYHRSTSARASATDGYVDWRKKAASILPDDLSGKRCLDIGTYDGFWAFEMERAGRRRGRDRRRRAQRGRLAGGQPRAARAHAGRSGGSSWARASGSRTSCAAPMSNA